MWKDIGNFLSDKKVNKKSKITDVVFEEAVIIDVGSANVDKEAQHSSNVNSEEETFNRVSKKLKLGSSFIILGILFLGLAGVGFLILPKYFTSATTIGLLELRQIEVQDKLKKLSAQVAVLEGGDPEENSIRILEVVNPALVKLESTIIKLRALQAKQSEIFNRRIEVFEKSSPTSIVPSPEMKAYEQAISKIEKDLERQRSQIKKISNELQAQVREVKLQIKTEEQSASKISESAMTAAALDKIQTLVASGLGYQTVLAELSRTTDLSLSQAIVDNAKSGVASLSFLQNEFPREARIALKKIRSEKVSFESEGAFWSFVKAQLGVRSLTPQEGFSADAVLSRAQVAVNDGDIGAALIQIKMLTDVGQAVLKDWSLAAESRIRVLEELAKISDNVITN